MIIKLRLLLLFTCLSFTVFSQTVRPDANDCVQGFTINAITKPGENSRIDDIVIAWDFSETPNKSNIELSFEAQPLNECWKALEGSKRSETKTYKIDNFSSNIRGRLKLEYTDLNCKCLKWRALIIDPITNCETTTAWQFRSFL